MALNNAGECSCLIALNLSNARINNSKGWLLKRRLNAAKKEVFQPNLTLTPNFFFTASRSTSWEPMFQGDHEHAITVLDNVHPSPSGRRARCCQMTRRKYIAPVILERSRCTFKLYRHVCQVIRHTKTLFQLQSYSIR
jgi:hypothetical protein